MMNEERVLTETRVKLLYLRNSKHSEHFEGIANSYVRKCNFIIIFKQAKQATYSVGCTNGNDHGITYVIEPIREDADYYCYLVLEAVWQPYPFILLKNYQSQK